MAAIRKDFVGVVHVYVDGESVFLAAGDEVPEGAQIRGDVLAGGGDDIADEPAPEPEPEPAALAEAGPEGEGDDDLPEVSDSREAWNTYAESIGFDPSPYSKKEALIEALKQR